MKTLLLVLALTLFTVSAASADDFTVRSDFAGTNCHFSSGFYNNSIYVIERYSAGTLGARFKVVLPPGSTFISFFTPFTKIGVITDDISIAYGQCRVGTIVIGFMSAILTPGTITVEHAAVVPNVIYANCSFAEIPATTSPAYVDDPAATCNDPLATEPSTWGSVKALYR